MKLGKTRQQTDLRRQRSEHGGAMAFVLVIGASLFFIAAYSLTAGTSSRRAAAQDLQRRSAILCAESGIERAKKTVMLNQDQWNTILATPTTTTTWYPVVPPSGTPWYGNCVGAGGYTYRVTMRDNFDDGNQASDADGVVIIDSIASRRGVAMATVSAVVSGSVTKMMSGHRQEGGAQNTFNK